MNKILIIDDEIGVCLIISRFLTKNGYYTETAESGTTAFEKLKRQHFDLVISDFRLEDTDGREILKKIKTTYPKVAVIMMSNYGDDVLAAEMLELGAYEFINKPIYPKIILESVKNSLEYQKYINSGSQTA